MITILHIRPKSITLHIILELAVTFNQIKLNGSILSGIFKMMIKLTIFLLLIRKNGCFAQMHLKCVVFLEP